MLPAPSPKSTECSSQRYADKHGAIMATVDMVKDGLSVPLNFDLERARTLIRCTQASFREAI